MAAKPNQNRMKQKKKYRGQKRPYSGWTHNSSNYISNWITDQEFKSSVPTCSNSETGKC